MGYLHWWSAALSLVTQIEFLVRKAPLHDQSKSAYIKKCKINGVLIYKYLVKTRLYKAFKYGHALPVEVASIAHVLLYKKTCSYFPATACVQLTPSSLAPVQDPSHLHLRPSDQAVDRWPPPPVQVWQRFGCPTGPDGWRYDMWIKLDVVYIIFYFRLYYMFATCIPLRYVVFLFWKYLR